MEAACRVADRRCHRGPGRSGLNALHGAADVAPEKAAVAALPRKHRLVQLLDQVRALVGALRLTQLTQQVAPLPRVRCSVALSDEPLGAAPEEVRRRAQHAALRLDGLDRHSRASERGGE